MDTAKALIIGFFALVIISIPILLVGVAIAANGFSPDNQGEQLAKIQTTGSSDTGTLSDDVPALLASIFKEASGVTGTPASIIAAVSYQECSPLWTHTRKHPDIVQVWIEKNIDVDNNGCGYNNYAGASGPMQFLAGTFQEYQAETSKLTGHSPASRNNIRDAVFAAALKLRANSGVLKKTKGELPQASDWTESNVKSAAKQYFGRCIGKVRNTTVYYCDDIIRRWKQYGGLWSSSSSYGKRSRNDKQLSLSEY